MKPTQLRQHRDELIAAAQEQGFVVGANFTLYNPTKKVVTYQVVGFYLTAGDDPRLGIQYRDMVTSLIFGAAFEYLVEEGAKPDTVMVRIPKPVWDLLVRGFDLATDDEGNGYLNISDEEEAAVRRVIKEMKVDRG